MSEDGTPISGIKVISSGAGDGDISKEGAFNRIIAVAILGLAVIILMGIVYASALHSVTTEKKTLTVITRQIPVVTAQTQAYQPFDQVATLSSQMETTASTLAKARFNWPAAMQQVDLALPADVTLTSLSTSASTGSGLTFALSGCASSQNDVAKTLINLAEVPGVENVPLDTTTKNAVPAASLKGAALAKGSEASEALGGVCYVSFTLGLTYSPSYTIPDRLEGTR